jgi:hypothetical protein
MSHIHVAFHTSPARAKPLGVRLVKDDCGSVAATPLISGDIVDGPTFMSPSAAAAAATAVFAAPFITSIQPWEMTASCLSLLAAAAAHYPHLVSLLSNTSLIAVVIVITTQVLKYLPESLRCVDSLEQGAAQRLAYTRPSAAKNCSTRQLFSLIVARLTSALSGSCGVLLAQSLCANIDIIGAANCLLTAVHITAISLTFSCRSPWLGRFRLQRTPRNADRYVACGGVYALQLFCRRLCSAGFFLS